MRWTGLAEAIGSACVEGEGGIGIRGMSIKMNRGGSRTRPGYDWICFCNRSRGPGDNSGVHTDGRWRPLPFPMPTWCLLYFRHALGELGEGAGDGAGLLEHAPHLYGTCTSQSARMRKEPWSWTLGDDQNPAQASGRRRAGSKQAAGRPSMVRKAQKAHDCGNFHTLCAWPMPPIVRLVSTVVLPWNAAAGPSAVRGARGRSREC